MNRLADFYRVRHNQPLDMRRGTGGSSARVFCADSFQLKLAVAFKVLKAEHVGSDTWFFNSLLNEARLLHLLSNDKAVVNLYDCGFIDSDDPEPTDGDIVAFGLNVEALCGEGQKYLEEGWRPYLALELMPLSNNVPMLIAQGRRARIPREEAIELSLQFADLLCRTHQQNIVYRDFKLEHVFWDGNRLVLIDWNASAQITTAAACKEQPIELRKFVAAVMYPVFTLQNALGDGLYQSREKTPSQNEAHLASVRELQWGPDCVASDRLKDIMARAIAGGGGYTTTEEFKHDVLESAVELGWPLNGYRADSPAAKVHPHVLSALSHLRLGQYHLENAKESLEEVLGLSEDEEVARLYRDVCQFLAARVIP